ncbi:EAL domain-containing protein [Erythrobacter sp. YT30]|uniref:EAL domain-containing protein n=1 Tax=Erythrobacter sp. YT30 TaxID=1735012 RepID=UPI0018D23EC0|nr:EAL domain-containing protein [Erythrobacter sp. YT30]
MGIATTSPAGGDRSFAAVICFPSLALLRKATGDMATDHAISNFAQSIDGQFEDLRIQRIGKETIQCILTADTQDDAIAKMQAVVSVLGEDTYTNAKQGFEKPRAGLSEIEHFPAAQSAFDLALDSIEQDKDRLVNFAGGFGSSSGRKSSRELANDLREALKTDEVSLSYQPKLDVRNQTFRAAEALFRWDGGSARSHTIGDVILCAEKHGVIQDLTMWTLKRAVSDQLQLIDAGVELKTFVNLSGAVISDSEFTLKAVEIIKGASGRIGIEITETSVIEHASNALSNLELYEAAGAEIAIDDYGTGLSSLRYLKRIPAQELKIDREFIKDLTRSHRDPMIVRSTIDLAHALGLSVTAEGVDDPTKLALLKVMGCDQLQGFYIAKPMSLEALIAFLNDQNALISSLDSGPSLMLKRADVIGL